MYKLVIAYSTRTPAKGNANGAEFTVIRERDGAEFSLREFAAALGFHHTSIGAKLKPWDYGEYGFKFQIQIRMMLDRRAGRAPSDYDIARPEESTFEQLEATS